MGRSRHPVSRRCGRPGLAQRAQDAAGDQWWRAQAQGFLSCSNLPDRPRWVARLWPPRLISQLGRVRSSSIALPDSLGSQISGSRVSATRNRTISGHAMPAKRSGPGVHAWSLRPSGSATAAGVMEPGSVSRAAVACKTGPLIQSCQVMHQEIDPCGPALSVRSAQGFKSAYPVLGRGSGFAGHWHGDIWRARAFTCGI